MTAEATSAAVSLEEALGDPARPSSPLAWSAALEGDEREAFPEDGWRTLHAQDVFRRFVPARDGGTLHGLADLVMIGRVIARRDLTLAVATGQTFLGALPVWLDGDASQRAHVASLVMDARAGCLALTEEDHGSDLAATETTAVAEDGGGLVLDGVKWCINNAERSRFMTVLARHGEGHAVLLVDKARLPPAAFSCRPRLRTHGVRGADIGGISFTGARLDAGAVVGKAGGGLDLTLRALQLSRTACAAFSLGAGDTALRLASSFAFRRALYGKKAWDIPSVRHALEGALGDLLIAEAVTLVACRAASLVPAEMSVVSAVVKAVVPALVDDAIREAGVVLGARGYLREGPAAPFQKLARDHAVVGLFDGSTPVNLAVLAKQLPRLVAARADAPARMSDLYGPGGLFDLAGELPPLTFRGLRATARGADSLTGAIPALVPAAPAAASVHAEILAAELATFDREVRERMEEKHLDDAAAIGLARRYCLLAAGAACLGILVTRARRPTAGVRLHLLLAVLERIVARLGGRLDAPVSLASMLEHASGAGEMLSLLHVPLGR